SGGGLEQAHQQTRGGALAATGLADEAKRLPLHHLEADVIDRPDRAQAPLPQDPPADGEVLGETLDRQQRLLAHRVLAHDSPPWANLTVVLAPDGPRNCSHEARRSLGSNRQATRWVDAAGMGCNDGSIRA